MASESAILSWMLLLPAVGGGVVLALPEAHARKPWIGARPVAATFAIATLLVAAMAAGWMDFGRGDLQLTQAGSWLAPLHVAYAVGADGLSMPLALTAAAIGVIACWASYGIKHSLRAYFALLLWSMAAALGVLVLRDPVLLAVALAVLVVIAYFLIAGAWGGWGGDAGGERRVPAARRFLFLALPGAALVGAGAVMQSSPGSGAAAGWLALAGALLVGGFVPVFGWLSDALSESVPAVGMVLLGLLQTAAGYALMQLAMPMLRTADALHAVSWCGAVIAAYGILAALAQKQLARLAGWISISQFGLFLLGLSSRTQASVTGAAFLLLAHAIAAPLLIYTVGMIRARVSHDTIDRLGGLAGHMPSLASWSSLGFLGATGFPLLAAFVGELLVVAGTFMRPAGERPHAAMLGSVAGAVLILLIACGVWTYQRVFMGPPRPEHSNVATMSASERWILAVLGLCCAGLGVFPMLLTDPLRASVEAWLR